MREKLMANFAKKVHKTSPTPEDLIQNSGEILLNLIQAEPRSVSHAIHHKLLTLIKDPQFIIYFNSKPQTFVLWKKLITLSANEYYKSPDFLLEKIIDHIKPTFSLLIKSPLFKPYSVNLLTFGILTTSSIHHLETLNEITDILFNTFAEAILFRPSCLALKSLYLRVTYADFEEILRRIMPQLFIQMIKVVGDREDCAKFIAGLKLVEFFKLTKNEPFLMYEGALMASLKSIEGNINNLSLDDQIELVVKTSSRSEADIEKGLILMLEPTEKNCEQAIEVILLQLSNSKHYFNTEISLTQIEESIVFDLIKLP